jgi:hypothetical protein
MRHRGLVAPLSPNEEVTLRRVAHGVGGWDRSPQRDLDHLRQLQLVSLLQGRPYLTALGRQRYQGLPRPGRPDLSPGR